MGRVEKKDGEGNDKSDADEFWDGIGVDLDSLGPKGQAAAGAVTGGVILLVAAVVLFAVPHLWWMIFIFGWLLFPALGAFARGIAGLAESGGERPRADDREQELLQALRSNGELSPAQAAMETSMTVSQADGMLGELAEGGHLRVRVRGGGLFYSLWELDGGGMADREIAEPQ